MAFLETTIKRFIGTSRDDMPYPGLIRPDDGVEVTERDLPPGSTFMLKDKDGVVELFHWTGREWVSGDTPELHELRAVKALLGELVEQGRQAL